MARLAALAAAVVQHLEVAAIGVGVGGAGGELVENLVGPDHPDGESLCAAVGFGEAFGGLRQRAAGRDDDHHVHVAVGVEVLVLDGAHDGGGGVGGRCVEHHVAPVAPVYGGAQRGAVERRSHFGHGVAGLPDPPYARPGVGVADFEGNRPRRGGRKDKGRAPGGQLPFVADADVVQAGRDARRCGKAEGVTLAECRRRESRFGLAGQVRFVGARDVERADSRVAQRHAYGHAARRRVRGEAYGYAGLLAFDDARRGDVERAAVALREVVAVVKAPAAGKPAVGIVVHDGMGRDARNGLSAVGGGVECRQGGGCRLALGQEVVGIGRVGIVRVRPAARTQRPALRALSKKQERALAAVEGHLLEVVGGAVGRAEVERLGLRSAAVTVEADAVRAVEAHLRQLGVGELVNALLADANLDPASFGQHRAVRPSVGGGPDCAPGAGAVGAARLDRQLERHEAHGPSVAHDERQHRHVELPFLAADAEARGDLQRVGQGDACAAQASGFRRGQRGIFGIVSPHGVAARCVVAPHRDDRQPDAVGVCVRRALTHTGRGDRTHPETQSVRP